MINTEPGGSDLGLVLTSEWGHCVSLGDMVGVGVDVRKIFPPHPMHTLAFRLYQEREMLSVLQSKIHFCRVKICPAQKASSTLVENAIDENTHFTLDSGKCYVGTKTCYVGMRLRGQEDLLWIGWCGGLNGGSKKYTCVLRPRICEWDLIQKNGFCRCDKLRILHEEIILDDPGEP